MKLDKSKHPDKTLARRHWVMSHRPAICTERAAIMTECYELYGLSLSPVRLRARALARVLEGMSIYLGPDDLIAGNQASAPRAAPVFPEYSWDWILDELDEFPRRTADRFDVSAEARAVLCELLPRWRNRSLKDRALATLPNEVLQAINNKSFILTSLSCGIGHLAPDYTRVLSVGLEGLYAEAEAKLNELSRTDPSWVRRREFLLAAMEVCQAGIRFGQRFVRLAEAQAAETEDPHRRQELLELAEICRRVPARPAASFSEAVQSFWFVHLIIQIESNGHSVSPGRFDQYMWPYLKADLAAGRIDETRAQNLLNALWIKFNEIMKLRDQSGSVAFGGYPLFQNLIVGGQTVDGTDATNQLSFLCLEATRQTRLPQPSLSVRIHANTPVEFFDAAAALAKEGLGMPAFFNDEAIIPVLLEMGVKLDHARDYAEVGCVEPQAPGRTNGYYPAGFLNLGQVVSLALNNGRDPSSGRAIGRVDAETKAMTTFEKVFSAFTDQVDHFIDMMVTGINCLDTVHMELDPSPFTSLLVDDCLQRGLAYEQGGAIYNYSSPNVVGLANAADSLAAVKKIVFDQGLLELGQLIRVVNNDFRDQEPIRQLLINKAPKYGNDEIEVDQLARRISSYILNKFKVYANPRLGRFEPGLQSISAHALFRGAVGATPDGRRSDVLLADGGISPAQGRDRKGPTAVVKSAARLDQLNASNGALLNVKLSPQAVAGTKGTNILSGLIKTYFQLGGQHIQFNILSSETLRQAQAHPDDYADLIVRVAGFSVHFVAIDRALQEDIIERTEHLYV